jgi:CHAT domain-containing protein/tetratricopeptide (TPR) repeat protein
MLPTLFRSLSTVLLIVGLSWVCYGQGVTPEEELASALVTAKTEGERATLLAAKKDLVTPKLVQALVAQGNKFAPQGKFPEALQVFDLALAISKTINDRAGTASALYATGQIYNLQDEFEPAAKNFGEALALREALADKGGAGSALNQLGVLQSKQGNYQSALNFYREALPLLEDAGNKVETSAVLNNIGNAYNGQGIHEQALEYYGRSLKLAEEAGSKARAAIALTNIGLVHSKQGNYALALESQQKALAIKESQKNKPGIAISLLNLGEVHRLQGNYGLALEFFEKSLKQFEEIGAKQGIGLALSNIGLVHQAQNNFPLATDFYQKALKQFEEIKDKAGIAETLNNLGLAQRDLARYDAALEFYKRSLAESEEVNDKPRIAQALTNIADTFILQNKHRDALVMVARAVKVANEVGSRETLWFAHTLSGKAYRALGQTAQAQLEFAEAIKQIELIRTQVAGGETAQQSFFENKLAPYQAMVELLVSQNKLSEALAYAERAKGRVLLDVLQSGRANITKSMSSSELAEERQLTNDLAALNTQLSRARMQKQPDDKRLDEIGSRLQIARRDYEAFETRLYAAHPELEFRRGGAGVLTLAQSEKLLDVRTVLLEYMVTDERVLLFSIALGGRGIRTADGLKVFPIEIKRRDLATQVENFRRALAERDPDFNQSAKNLYNLLVAPASDQLKGRSNLVIVPDGALWELPFQALRSSANHYLVEDSAVAYTPSLSVLYELQKLKPKVPEMPDRTLLAFGNPALAKPVIERTRSALRGSAFEPLPEAESEVKLLSKLYGPGRSTVYTGAEALEERAKAESSQYSVVHFATHAVLNNASPMYSYLALAQGGGAEDGLLESWEIAKLDLKARVVVLSACETARGRVGAGEGMIGLTWAFFVAGSPATVVSQWKVDSAATKLLMLDFHRGLKSFLGNPKITNKKAEALRMAALTMLRNSEYRHPFYWASFVVVGDGR